MPLANPGSPRCIVGRVLTDRGGHFAVEPGSVRANELTLSWAKSTEAADEAGASRRFGGIHFIDGDIEGRALGRKIGNAVFDRGNRLFEGRNCTVE